MNNILEIENLSKQYRLGTIGTGTLTHDLNRWWYRIRGKNDPYLKIGETNDRSSSGRSEYVWALRDINLNVKEGEVLGIIGKNGAGKSTLLKILSRVTGPTTGSIKAFGRIASLLEVGTGFHPELTGRENIFLNGGILGMTKQEIRSKFDEIVDFSGCERYIDTPVKRYSSGMYVRLAFAVAAHLEPEILIVDEVLAVGDAEFQKKAIGKMKDVSQGQGRTVLFVSHNLRAVQSLCSRLCIVNEGSLIFEGQTNIGLNNYLKLSKNKIIGDNVESIKREEKTFGRKLYLSKCKLLDKSFNNISEIKIGEEFIIEAKFVAIEDVKSVSIVIGINSADDYRFLTVASEESDALYNINSGQTLTIKARFNKLILNHGDFYVSVGARNSEGALDLLRNIVPLSVSPIREQKVGIINDNLNGLVKTNVEWIQS